MLVTTFHVVMQAGRSAPLGRGASRLHNNARRCYEQKTYSQKGDKVKGCMKNHPLTCHPLSMPLRSEKGNQGNQRMKLYPVYLLAALLLAVVGTVWETVPTTAQTTHLQTLARLNIPSAITATTGMSVTVPIAFQNGGNAIGSTTFSIDFDQSCLTFNPSNGVQFKTPLAFRGSFSYDASDGNGEVDVVIADYSLPTASLPDADPLLTLRFTPHCTPTANTVIIAPVRFSSEIVASFGDVNGLDVAGTTVDGSVAIQLPPAQTPTATPTSTPTPGPGTPSATPTALPSATSTSTPPPGPGTPSATPPATPTTTSTSTPTPGPGTPSATPTVTPAPGTPPATTTPDVPTPPHRHYAPLIYSTEP